MEQTYSGKEFKDLAKENGWILVKYLASNDLREPQKEHYNFHYKLGLNENSDLERGLYFTFVGSDCWYKNKHCFFVDVSDEACVTIEPDDKFKADKLILLREASEDFYAQHYKKNVAWLNHIHQTEEICMEAVKVNSGALKYIKEQTKAVCLEAMKRNGLMIMYVKDQTEDICIKAVRQNERALQNIKEQTEAVCMEAVKQDGLALYFVKDQTEAICLEAVKQNAKALSYVREQTEKICLEAVKRNGWLLEYVKNRTKEICMEAIKQNWRVLQNCSE